MEVDDSTAASVPAATAEAPKGEEGGGEGEGGDAEGDEDSEDLKAALAMSMEVEDAGERRLLKATKTRRKVWVRYSTAAL